MQNNYYAFLFVGSHAGSAYCSLELLSSWKQQKQTIMSFNLSAQRKTNSVTHSFWSLKVVGPIFLHNHTLQNQKNSHRKLWWTWCQQINKTLSFCRNAAKEKVGFFTQNLFGSYYDIMPFCQTVLKQLCEHFPKPDCMSAQVKTEE